MIQAQRSDEQRDTYTCPDCGREHRLCDAPCNWTRNFPYSNAELEDKLSWAWARRVHALRVKRSELREALGT